MSKRIEQECGCNMGLNNMMSSLGNGCDKIFDRGNNNTMGTLNHAVFYYDDYSFL
jgi:hypothetical protein